MAKNILICDDAAFMRMMIKDILTKNGYNIAGEAENGQKAVEKYAELKPDLVLMDITMPEMDGISVCKEIRDKIGCPILFLTAKDQETDKIDGFTAGGDDYITKPFSLAELKVRIDAHLRREHREKQIQRKVFGDMTEIILFRIFFLAICLVLI